MPEVNEVELLTQNHRLWRIARQQKAPRGAGPFLTGFLIKVGPNRAVANVTVSVEAGP